MKILPVPIFVLSFFLLGCKPDHSEVLPESGSVTKPIMVFGNTGTLPSSGFGFITNQTDRLTKNSSGGWVRTQMLSTGSTGSCYAGGILYAPSSQYQNNSTILQKDFYAVDVSTGAIKWQILNHDKVFGVSFFQNDTLYVSLASTTKPYLAAINARTGAFFWEHELPVNFQIFKLWVENQTAFFAYSIPTAPPGTVTALFHAGVGSFNLTTRSVNWNRDMAIQSYDDGFFLIFDAPRIYINSDRTLLCLDKTNGQTVWSKPVFFSEIKFQSGLLFTILGTTANHGIYALSADNGNEVWKRMMAGGTIIYHIAESSDRVIIPIISSTNRRLLCLNKSTGADIWEAPMNYNTNKIEILERMLIVRRTSSDALMFYNIENGNKTDSLVIQPDFFQKAYIMEEGGKIKGM